MKKCEDCKSYKCHYADGYVYRDWSGRYEGDPKDLPYPPDKERFWTWDECLKNSKGLKYINLSNDCSGFEKKPK